MRNSKYSIRSDIWRVARSQGALLLLLLAAIGCGEQRVDTRPPSVMAVAFCDPDGSHQSEMRDTLHNPFPHLRFSDSAISLNDRCPVRKVPLNKRLPAMLVNGRPVGFC